MVLRSSLILMIALIGLFLKSQGVSESDVAKKENLDDRRVSSFNRIRKMPKPEIIPAALRPAFGALYWETLITVALMCSFIPFVIRFGEVDPIHALVYTLCTSILVISVLRIGTRVVFKNKSGRIYRRLTATTACILAMASLFTGAAILKSGWDQDDFRFFKGLRMRGITWQPGNSRLGK